MRVDEVGTGISKMSYYPEQTDYVETAFHMQIACCRAQAFNGFGQRSRIRLYQYFSPCPAVKFRQQVQKVSLRTTLAEIPDDMQNLHVMRGTFRRCSKSSRLGRARRSMPAFLRIQSPNLRTCHSARVDVL